MIAGGQMLSSDFARLLSHRMGYRPEVPFPEAGASRFLAQRLPRARVQLSTTGFTSCTSKDAASRLSVRCCLYSRQWRLALAVKTTAGDFHGDANEDDASITHFPTARPKGVTANEWRALTASRVTDAAETGLTSYTLQDLDELCGHFRRNFPNGSSCDGWGGSRRCKNFSTGKTKPQLLSQLGFRNLILTMTYSHMGKPHTTIGDASFHC